MSQSENSEVWFQRSRTVICVSVVLLALAVFGWGLRSKLSLYHVARASEAIPIAKLLSERERSADTVQHCHLDDSDLDPTASPVSVVLIPFPENAARAKESREDAPSVPSRTVTFKGPSLRRPPPSLVA
jgi:hypothetical protein